MQQLGWVLDEVSQDDFPTLDMNSLLKQKSMYGADALCGCAYDDEKNLLISARIDRADSSNCRIMAYRKK